MYRPYYYDRISAGLDEQGMPIAWSHRIVGSSIMARFFPPLFKDGIDPDAVDGAVDMPYAIPNKHVEYVREEPPGIPTAFWRGVGPTHNVYVIESFIDELAAIAKKDPVEYRRAMLGKNPRALHVLNRAAEMAGWGKPLADRRGRGVCVHNTFGSFMAQIAEVTVSKSGEVHVDRVVCVVDTGVAVNPDTIVAQMQSGIIFGITAVLWGEITLKNGRVEQTNFTTIECCASMRLRSSRSRWSRAAPTPVASASPARQRWRPPCSTRSMPQPECGCASCRSTRRC